MVVEHDVVLVQQPDDGVKLLLRQLARALGAKTTIDLTPPRHLERSESLPSSGAKVPVLESLSSSGAKESCLERGALEANCQILQRCALQDDKRSGRIGRSG
jgi:hypothetical protein